MIDFLEDAYVSQLLEGKYKEVDRVELPDGTYHKYDSGYQFGIHSDIETMTFRAKGEPEYYTGYVVVTNTGIRGAWNGEPVNIKDGVIINEDIYKIFTNRIDIIREEKIEELLK